MMMSNRFIKCVHGGGGSCRNQGGDGSMVHGPNYMHKHPHHSELHGLNVPIGSPPDALVALAKSIDYFIEDEDVALDILSTASEILNKSLYHFDFDKYDGIERVLELLPILDTEVIKDIYATVFPGYPVDDDSLFNPRMAKLELRGFFMDFLANYGSEPQDAEDPTQNETGEQAPNTTLAAEARNNSPASEVAA